MVYPVESYYVTFGGTLVQGEIWQCGFKCAPTNGEDIFQGAFDNISVEDIYNRLKTWFQSGDASTGVGSSIGKPATLGWAKVAVLDRNGEYKFDAHTYVPQTAASPVFSTVQAPQVCIVVTLWSGQKVQRANYGRFYQPSPQFAAGAYSEGKLTAALCANVRDAAKSMIHDVNGEVSTVGVQTYPAILSHVGAGQVRAISQIGVGRVLDTQRRRRSSLDEDIVYTAF